jgi:hypothetical protein
MKPMNNEPTMNIHSPSLLPSAVTANSSSAVSLLRPDISTQPAYSAGPTSAHTRQTRAISAATSGQENKTIGLKKEASALAPSSQPDVGVYSKTIYGSDTPSPPSAGYTIEERKQRINEYNFRVAMQVEQIPGSNEGETNVNFQNVRLFLEPSGYFSGGLLAAGYDPHEKFTVTFTSYTGMGKPENLSSTDKRTYFAWEIAAGALAHDRVERGGPVNFNFMEIESKDRSKVDDLESLGKVLQNNWEQKIAKVMRDPSELLVERSGKADAYAVRGTLQSLSSNKESFEHLSPEGQVAVKRTLEQNGQVIIPNLYGYPMSGYAFVPYTPYDGNYEHRPNQGVMIDFRNGTVREIHGDKDFAAWAKDNRNNLVRSFNTGDVQGGKDAHWQSAEYVLDTLISGANVHYPGYNNLLSDQEIPVSELFNYTRSRGGDYRLKFGNLNNGIASQYQMLNAKNSVWSDQTEVFGSSQQSWKAAKDFWGNTFGYVPVVGYTGNVVFGIHDGIYGKTADDRAGGNAAAVISGLLLVHEVVPIAVEFWIGGAPVAINSTSVKDYSWRYSSQTSEFELARVPKPSSNVDEVIISEPKAKPTPEAGRVTGEQLTNPEINLLRPSQSGNISEHAVPNGEQLIENAKPNTKGIYQIKNRIAGKDQWLIRYTDDTGSNKVYEIRSDFKLRDNYVQIIDPETRKPLLTVQANGEGEWVRASAKGGVKWPWQRSPSPTPSNDLKTPPKLSDGFEILGDPKISGADRFDQLFRDSSNTAYQQSVSNFEEAGAFKRKLTVSWTVEENNFEVYPSEKAQPNEHAETSYSPNFLKDLNRDRYTVRIKQPEGYTTVELDATGSADGETLRKRLQQFEDAIPDPNLRSRISEVAHQGSVAPTSVELKINQLQDHVGFKGKDTHYSITYDPATSEAQVSFDAQMTLLDLNKDAAVIPNVETVAQRTFLIRESNELEEEANPYAIDKSAPFTLSTSVISDLK